MSAPYYYEDALVTLYHGDCLELDAWLEADVLVTDPPYGRDWQQRDTGSNDPRYRNASSNARGGIAGDKDTTTRDAALALWGQRPAVAFGDLMLAPPIGTKHVLIYAKPGDAGQRGGVAGFRRDTEAIYLIGKHQTNLGGRSSVVTTGARNSGGQFGLSARYGHPHAKPLDVMHDLLSALGMAVGDTVADPFAGSGSTLVAAKQAGMRAIGVELEEAYCEAIASRLDVDDLFGVTA